jgi:hypothetical protein
MAVLFHWLAEALADRHPIEQERREYGGEPPVLEALWSYPSTVPAG